MKLNSFTEAGKPDAGACAPLDRLLFHLPIELVVNASISCKPNLPNGVAHPTDVILHYRAGLIKLKLDRGADPTCPAILGRAVLERAGDELVDTQSSRYPSEVVCDINHLSQRDFIT